MTTTHTVRYSAIAKRHYAEGEAKGERHAIRMVLRARRLELSEEQSARIDACDDLEILKKWSEAALTATDAADIFG